LFPLDLDDHRQNHRAAFRVFEQEGADVVVSGYQLYEDQAHIKDFPWQPTDDFIARQLGEGLDKGSHYSAFLFRRSFVQDIPHRTSFPAADFASRDDRCFILEVALRKPVIAAHPGHALCHRQHAKGRLQFQSGLRSVGTNIQHLLIYRQILGALNRAVEEQIWTFRDSELAKGPQTCPYTGEAVTKDNYHVDHPDPTFFELQAKWFEKTGLTPAGIKISDGSKNEIGRQMTDREQKKSWQAFHLGNARLRLLSPLGNLSGAKIEANRRMRAK